MTPLIVEYSLNTIDNAAKTILELLNPYGFVGFSGPLGAGKTTLISQLLKKMNYKENVTSPTYVLEHIYDTPTRIVHHWDLYRLQSAPEELLYGRSQKGLYLIEWPEKDERIMEQLEVKIVIKMSSSTRKLIAEVL